MVNPLPLDLTSPYAFAQGQYFRHYPFTSTIIVIRGLAVFLTPLVIFSLFKKSFFAKGAICLVMAGLLQLYALQDIATNSATVPMEWALSLALGGILLLIPTVYYFFRGLTDSAHTSLKEAAVQTTGDASTPEWLDPA